jgi:hypothetical protein
MAACSAAAKVCCGCWWIVPYTQLSACSIQRDRWLCSAAKQVMLPQGAAFIEQLQNVWNQIYRLAL